MNKFAHTYITKLAELAGLNGRDTVRAIYDLDKEAATGLWDNIRAKKERGEKPAKPGDEDYPDSESWKEVTAISEKGESAE